MWYMKLCYGILLLISVLFAILYKGSFSLMLLCLLQIVPIFLYLISWYLRCRLHITLLNGSGRM